jgi:hypothetical protein
MVILTPRLGVLRVPLNGDSVSAECGKDCEKTVWLGFGGFGSPDVRAKLKADKTIN